MGRFMHALVILALVLSGAFVPSRAHAMANVSVQHHSALASQVHCDGAAHHDAQNQADAQHSEKSQKSHTCNHPCHASFGTFNFAGYGLFAPVAFVQMRFLPRQDIAHSEPVSQLERPPQTLS